MTELSATQIAQLTALLTGGGMKRSATKEAAAKRFLNVAAETGAFGEEAARTTLEMDFDAATKIVQAIKAGIDQANAPAPAAKTSPGLARLRASQDAEAIRNSTTSEADAARAAVVAGMPVDPHAASNALIGAFVARGGLDDTEVGIAGKNRAARKAALALGTEPEAKPAKAPKAPKAPKPEKAEGSTSRTKVAPTQKIVAVVANPKKAGSKSFAIFSLYVAGQTAEDFIKAVVAAGYSESDAKGNLSWDRRKGFITIEEVKVEAIAA